MRAISLALAVLFVVSGCTLRPTYVVGGRAIGSPESVRVAFMNGNTPGMRITYRVFIDDPGGKHNVIVVRPDGQASSVVDVPVGRVRLYYEVYRDAVYVGSRVRHVLIDPPQPGTIQRLTIVEPE